MASSAAWSARPSLPRHSSTDGYGRSSARAKLGSDGAYVADASEVDWSGFRWQLAESHAVESWLWRVAVEVDGGLAALPEFLRVEQLVGPSCTDAASAGIRLMVARDGLFGPWTLGPGALTGTSEWALLLGKCS